MTRQERLRLLLELKMDPQGFEKRAHEAMSKLLELETNPPELDERAREEREAIFKENWQFLAQVLEALKSKGFMPFPEKVAAAYARLFPVHGLNVTVPIIEKKVVAMFPETANKTPQQYSRAFRKLGLPKFKK